MSCDHRTFLAFVLLATAVFNYSAAASPYDKEVLITPYTTTFLWEHVMPVPPGPVPPIIVAGPVHGDLVSGPEDSLQYIPEISFWELGTDSFVFRVDAPEPDTYVTVTLQAGDHGTVGKIDQSFEQQPICCLSGNAEVLPEAAIAGVYGLRATAIGGWTPDAVFTFLNEDIQGPGAQGGTDEAKVRPPGVPLVAGEPIVIYALDREPGSDPAADLVLIPIDEAWSLSARLYHGKSIYATPPLQLQSEHQLVLDWWNDDGEMRAGGLRLWVDGELAGSITDKREWKVGKASRRVGVMLGPNAETDASVDIDDLRLSWSDYPRAAFEPILRDDFDDDLGAWESSGAPFTDPFIEVTAEAALIGTGGLEIEAQYPVDSALWDPSPAAETSFGVRMLLSTESLAMTTDRTLEFLALSVLDTASSAGDQARLVLRRDLDEFKLIAQARSFEVGDGWRSTPAVALSTGINTIELRWQVADPGDENGWMRLWVNGIPGPRISGLVNAGAAIRSQRLGAWNVEAGAQGELFVDGFESWAFVPREWHPPDE